VIDLSTSYPASTRKIAEELGQRAITVLDAPLTGSRTHAESGKLNVMCGGPIETFERVRPLFDAIAANVFHVGAVGAGHTIKLINNFLGQVTVAAVCEILPFAQKSGVSLKSLYDVVSVSGGNSNQFQGLLPRVMQREFGINFQQKYVHKDIRYITMSARESRVPTPLANALLSVHDMALDKGYGDEDFSGLLKFWEEMSGVKVVEGGGQ
jgi:3-hydroxyisobutyrate dehydrogenase-like beta-hydroxyacid dehydrogenase